MQDFIQVNCSIASYKPHQLIYYFGSKSLGEMIDYLIHAYVNIFEILFAV